MQYQAQGKIKYLCLTISTCHSVCKQITLASQTGLSQGNAALPKSHHTCSQTIVRVHLAH